MEGVGCRVVAVVAATRALECVVETLAALTHPAHLSGRHTSHQGIVLDIASDHGTGGNERAASDGMPTDDGAISSQRRPLLNERAGINTMHREVGTRGDDIGEHTRGTTEDVVFYLDTLVDRDIVLDADTIANNHVVANVDVLSQRAVVAQTRTPLNVAEVPHIGALAYLDIVIDITGRMNHLLIEN